MKKFTFAAAAAFTALVATGAVAEPFSDYGSEAGWDIKVNEKMGPGCLLSRVNDEGSQLQMGIDATSDPRTGYIAVYTKLDTDVTQGENVQVELDVDGEKFGGTAAGQELKGYSGAFVPVNNEVFVYDLAKKHVLTVLADGEPKVVVDLKGTNAAFEALRACQEAQ